MNTKRIVAGIIDFFIIALIYEIPFAIFVMLPLITGQISTRIVIARALYCTLFALLLLILKDVFKNGSIGKRIMKLEIIDSKTQEKALLTKRILRNVTWVFSFIEVIFLIASDKRIGDRITGTEVVEKKQTSSS